MGKTKVEQGKQSMSVTRVYKRTDPKTGRKYNANTPKGRELFKMQKTVKKRAETREKNAKTSGRFLVKNIVQFKYTKSGEERPSARAAFDAIGEKGFGKCTCVYDGEKKVLMQRSNKSPYWMPWDVFVNKMKARAKELGL